MGSGKCDRSDERTQEKEGIRGQVNLENRKRKRVTALTTRGPAADGLGGILEISYVGKALFW